MLGEATRRQFSLTLDRVRAIAEDNTALEESRGDARRIQRILEAFDLDQPSLGGAEPHVPVALRNEWQMLKAIVLTVDTPLAQVGHAARTMRQAEALGRALPPVPVVEAHGDETGGGQVKEPSPPEAIATPRRATFKISNYDEAVRIAGTRGAPAATDLGMLVNFFMVSSSVGEGIGIIFSLLQAALAY